MKTKFLIFLLPLLAAGCMKPESCTLNRHQRSPQLYAEPMTLRDVMGVYFDMMDGDTVNIDAFLYRYPNPNGGWMYYMLDFPTYDAYYAECSLNNPRNQIVRDSIMQGRGNISCSFVDTRMLQLRNMPSMPENLFEQAEACRCKIKGGLRFVEEQTRGYSTDGPCGEDMSLTVISTKESIIETINE